MIPEIPATVLNRISHALAILRQIDAALEVGRDLDRRFGGQGRYEAETWETSVESMARQTALLADFRSRAAGMGIDGDAVIADLGGQVAPALSSEGQAWVDDRALCA